MAPLLRTHCSPVIVIAILLSLNLAWAPTGHAQEATPPSSACAGPGVMLADEEFPTGVIREEVLGQTPTLDNAGAATNTVVAASIVCFEPGTLVEIEMLTPDMFTPEIGHRFTTTFTVIEGELQVELVHLCVPNAAGGTCTGTDGNAYYYSHDDLTAQQTFGAGWTTLTTGDIVVLSGVTVKYQTSADQHARILVSGVYRAIDGGGCPRACWTP